MYGTLTNKNVHFDRIRQKILEIRVRVPEFSLVSAVRTNIFNKFHLFLQQKISEMLKRYHFANALSEKFEI